MIFRASSRLPSCCNPAQICPFALLESTPRSWHRAYTTIQKQKGPSKKRVQGWKPRDQYAIIHAEQRKSANINRQAELRKQRAASMGDPIRGITTPFLTALDTNLPIKKRPAVEQVSDTPESGDGRRSSRVKKRVYQDQGHLRNHFLTRGTLSKALEYSKRLTEPLVDPDRAAVDMTAEAEAVREHQHLHDASRRAVNRIVNLRILSSKERMHVNTQKIINTFGRHQTDLSLRPKAPSLAKLTSPNADELMLKRPERAGKDTGSSEVQIGILTAKIRVLADHYEGNRKDKANKRNLRLLLHRRQKLLKYMEKKERGSGRWQNMIEKLGLTEATWKGEIAVQ